MNKVYQYIILVLIFPLLVSAQEPAAKKENIALKTSVNGSEIRLRWAPANTKAWLEGRKYGYVLEKITAFKDGEFQNQAPTTIIEQAFLPAPLNQWEDIVNTSDYAAVIAQAFYGEEFSLTSNAVDYGTIINQANELEQRFATSIIMSQYDYKAALLAGWGWTDTNVKDNERYLYRIRLNKPIPEQGDTAIAVIGLKDKKSLPKPIGLNVIFGDKAVILSWNYIYQSDTYHSFHVERASTKDKQFRQITELPVTPMGENMQMMFFTDSLPANDQVYTYRIKGITAFGELGPYSDEISGQGKKTLDCKPDIHSAEFFAPNQAKVIWNVKCSQPDLLTKIEIKQSKTIDGTYKTIVDHIPPTQTTALLTLADSRNYLTVHVTTKDGEEMSSNPYMLQQVDSIPPAVPLGLQVSIDTTGVARLAWTMNTEKDLRGYRVLRGLTETEEMTSITPQFITESAYTDSLSLKLLNKHIYYRVSALDTYYNESEPSVIVMALKPDMTAPALPVITAYEAEGGSVSFSWTTDTQRPDVTYTLQRKAGDKDTYQDISKADHTGTYTDTPDESDEYSYRVKATSMYGRVSYSPQTVTVSIKADNSKFVIANFSYYKDEKKQYVELSWKKHPKAVLYRLYKQEGDQPAMLLTELNATQVRFVDERVFSSTRYTYTLVMRTEKGENSKPKAILVNY